MKVSDYVVQFLVDRGVHDLFMISGGGCIHLIDSVGRNRGIRYVCNLHEQACAMAMEGYAREKNDLGVCLVTTGPGATNAITGLIGTWLDSIPSMVISGQVKRSTMRHTPAIRQIGDQEINIVDVVRPITKYAVTVTEPEEIRYHLEKAYFLAKSGRPGPVWLDIPLDVQWATVDENTLRPFDQKECEMAFDAKLIGRQADEAIAMLQKSKRPVLLVGKGVRLAKAEEAFLKLVEKLRIPVIPSFTGYDLIEEANPYNYGREGIFGQRRGNFVVQNSDLLLCLGTRLNLRMISYNSENFAREAKKIIVDIDPEELKKPTIKADLPINSDAKFFINLLLERLGERGLEEKGEWLAYADKVYKQYPVPTKEQLEEKGYANVYVFINELSKMLNGGETVVLANGLCCIGPYQAFETKKNQRIIVNSGCASMGYGLPAAVGACVAKGRTDVICLEGDGSLQMNIQELQTVKHYGLPIKLFVINNGGYLSIMESQRNLFEGRLVACAPDSGVSCPSMKSIAKAYGIDYTRIASNSGIRGKIKKMLSHRGPIICEVMTSPERGFMVRISSQKDKNGNLVSKPLEDMAPFLPRGEFRENMLVKRVNDGE